MTPRVRSLEDRFWSRVDARGPDDCWLWTGPVSSGYGKIGAPGGRGAGTLGAHVVSYELAYGSVPVGRVVDHLCENTLCVNPAHLEAVTQQVNCERGRWGQKTHCPHGHPLDGWRRHYMKRLGRHITHRYCKTCKRAADRKRKAAAR